MTDRICIFIYLIEIYQSFTKLTRVLTFNVYYWVLYFVYIQIYIYVYIYISGIIRAYAVKQQRSNGQKLKNLVILQNGMVIEH